jgi:hypothetical protein
VRIPLLIIDDFELKPLRPPHDEDFHDLVAERSMATTWAQRLNRVFNIDIQICSACGGTVKVIACIEKPVVIKQILDHLENQTESPQPTSHPVRALPACLELDQS